MFVTSTKGERIGKVMRRDDDTFVVEKGTLFPKDYELRYDHITAVDGGGITYSLSDLFEREARSQGRSELRSERRPEIESQPTSASLATDAPVTTAAPAASRTASAKAATATASESGDNEVRIPLMQEELEVEKVPRESGHVRIHKGVKTEERHFTVPIRREEIVIEHVTAFAGGAGSGEPVTFEEETLEIPLHEEEIRVTKRPVLREEIVVRTVSHSVEKEATATLRHEEADVEDTRKTAAGDESRTESRSGHAGLNDGYGAPGRR